MKYYDKPVIKQKDDLLCRASFANRMANALLALSSEENITIGLYGEWGSGKTTVLNMVIEEIEAIASDSNHNDRNAPIIVRFEPWNITDDANLFVQFFQLLKEEVLKDKKGKMYKKLIESLNKYSSVIELAGSVLLGSNVVNFGKIINIFKSKNDENGNISLISAKKALESELCRFNRKIIIVIDDIDRLANNQIRTIFQLVSSIAGLPNLVYLLAMDRSVVVRALEEVQDFNGEAYLEKIVQVPFELPKMNHNKVLDIFTSNLEIELNEKDNDFHIDETRWANVYRLCVHKYIKNIRDANRILNVFSFNYHAVHTEADFIDLIAITILQVLKPEVYIWITKNKEFLCNKSDEIGLTLKGKEKEKENREYYYKSIGVLDNEAEGVLEILESLFPILSRKIGGYNGISDESLLRNRNIGHHKYFDMYFELNIDDIPFKKVEIDSFVNKLDKTSMIEMLNTINEKTSIVLFVSELRAYKDKIPQSRVKMLIRLLYDSMHKFKDEANRSIFKVSAINQTRWLINDLISQVIDSKERVDIFQETISNGSIFTLNSIVPDLHSIEIAYGRMKETDERVDKQIITLEQLIVLEQEFSKRINELTVGKELEMLDIDNLAHLVYFWDYIDSISCDRSVRLLLSEKQNILKFITRMGNEWISTSSRGCVYNEKYYSKWISDSQILSTISELEQADQLLKGLSDNEILKLSFYWLSKTKGDDRIEMDEAKMQVLKWKRDME